MIPVMATLMSKGLGHVGRSKVKGFRDQSKSPCFCTVEGHVCERVYGGKSSRAERVAVLRAVKGLAARRPDLGIKGVRGEFSGRGRPMTFFNRYRVLSYAMGRLKDDNFLPWCWKPEAELRARLAPGGRDRHWVEPGGAWWRHTEMEIAKRDGDHEKLARLEAEQERVMEGYAERIDPLIPEAAQ